MTTVLACILRALGQMGSLAFLSVIILGMVLAAGVMLGLALAVGGAIFALVPPNLGLPFLNEVGWLLALGGTGAMLALLVFAVIPVATLFMGMMLDRVVNAVEARHYPALPPAQPLGLYNGLRSGINFLGLVIAVNILALVFYAISGPFAPLVFLGVNGYLLGREYFAQIALRRYDRAAAKALARAHRGQIWLAGVCMAIPLSMPILNLVIPVLAVATFTHLFHRLTRPENPSQNPLISPPSPW